MKRFVLTAGGLMLILLAGFSRLLCRSSRLRFFRSNDEAQGRPVSPQGDRRGNPGDRPRDSNHCTRAQSPPHDDRLED